MEVLKQKHLCNAASTLRKGGERGRTHKCSKTLVSFTGNIPQKPTAPPQHSEQPQSSLATHSVNSTSTGHLSRAFPSQMWAPSAHTPSRSKASQLQPRAVQPDQHSAGPSNVCRLSAGLRSLSAALHLNGYVASVLELAQLCQCAAWAGRPHAWEQELSRCALTLGRGCH